MNTSATRAFQRQLTPWLLACTLATTLPHFLHQPYWLSCLVLLLTGWAAQRWRQDTPLPGRWLVFALLAAGCAGVLLEFRTLLGRDAGVALLALLMAMKLFEVNGRRDAFVMIMLGYFLLLTHYFHSQSLVTGLWLLLACWLLTASLVKLNEASLPAREALRHGGQLGLQAIPFMLLLYLLFPRISGPLWGLPADAQSARSGLSDSMAPGSIANLVLSSEIAFRVRFAGPVPARQQLYWRGPVMEQFDGTTWRVAKADRHPPAIVAESPAVDYETTLEPGRQRWLLALDAPVDLPAGSSLDNTLTANADQPLDSRHRFRLRSVLDYRFNLQEDNATLARNRQLPAARNPRTRALAQGWRAETTVPSQIVAQALALFARENFIYTLRPPRLGPDSIDEFLFDTRRGFCEHYAAAFVVLMRSAGIPARVVGGYQGGEINPFDGFVVVRQFDAHAWAEVWIEGEGWRRVDPTAAVSPTRIERGIDQALPAGEVRAGLITLSGDGWRVLRQRWEALNNAWNQYVLGYDGRRQFDLLARLGLPDANWRTLAIALGAACSILLALITLWSLYHRPRLDPGQRLWQKALRQLRRRKVDCPPWETPLALLHRLAGSHPELARQLAPVVHCYLLVRYAPADARHLPALRKALSRLH